ncbi:MAG TPA: glycosyltransferase, partial [Microthrixaceae bacterium]|nr:glycosyltransferase [Microthrixaceae bacterium]
MTAASPSSNPLPPTSKVVELMGPAVGGIRTHVAELTRRLRAAGRDVVVAGPPDALGHLGRNDVVVDVPAGLSPWGLVRARRQLGRVEGQLLHAHGLKAGWVAVGDPRRRPVVLTLHNLVLEESSGRSARVMRELERRLVRRVDRVIAPSPAIASGCEGLIAPDRLAVIVPVSPSPVPRRPRAEVRAELGADGAGPLVVVVARLHPQKDLSTFLRAMKLVAARVPDVRAAIVGQGPLEAELVRAIDELGLRETVRLAGPSDHAVDELAAADVVALTSVWEAVPLVVAEAAQLGRPIVSTDVGIVS